MSGKNFLDQRGTGARHADDENGIRCFATESRPVTKEFLCEMHPGAPDKICEYIGRIARSFLPELIVLPVVIKRFGILTGVFEGFSQSKMQLRPGSGE